MPLRLSAISAFCYGQLAAQSLLPANWDSALAGDIVMQRLIRESLYRKAVKTGERLTFEKIVPLMIGAGVEIRLPSPK